jgi:uncharacterized protein YbdZ (MbtH family)
MSHGFWFVHNVYKDGQWVTEIDRAPQGWRIVAKDDQAEHVHRWVESRPLARRAA